MKKQKMRNMGTNKCSTCDNFEQCPQIGFSDNVQSGFCVGTQAVFRQLQAEKDEANAQSDAESLLMEAI